MWHNRMTILSAPAYIYSCSRKKRIPMRNRVSNFPKNHYFPRRKRKLMRKKLVGIFQISSPILTIFGEKWHPKTTSSMAFLHDIRTYMTISFLIDQPLTWWELYNEFWHTMKERKLLRTFKAKENYYIHFRLEYISSWIINIVNGKYAPP